MPVYTVLTYHPAFERDKLIDEFLCISLPESDGHHMVSSSTFYKKVYICLTIVEISMYFFVFFGWWLKAESIVCLLRASMCFYFTVAFFKFFNIIFQCV